MDYLKEAITAHYGERCKDDEPGCPCCDAWRQYDGLMAEKALADRFDRAVSSNIGLRAARIKSARAAYRQARGM